MKDKKLINRTRSFNDLNNEASREEIRSERKLEKIKQMVKKINRLDSTLAQNLTEEQKESAELKKKALEQKLHRISR